MNRPLRCWRFSWYRAFPQRTTLTQSALPTVGRFFLYGSYSPVQLVRGILLLIVYTAVVHFSYIFAIAPSFGYLGYGITHRTVEEVLVVYFFAGLSATFLPGSIRVPSHLIMLYTITFVYVPTVVVAAFGSSLTFQKLVSLYLWLTASLALLAWTSALPRLRIPNLSLSTRLWWGIVGAMGLSCLGYLASTFSIRPPTLTLFDAEIYNIRMEAREMGTLAGYALRFAGNVFGPLLISYGLTRPKASVLFAGILVQIFVFSLDATKSTLFSLILLLVVSVIVRRQGGGGTFIGLTTAGITALLAVYFFFEEVLPLMSILVRRAIITPGLLTAVYYEFFQFNEPFLWSHSFLKPFLTSHYSLPPAFVIGAYYFGDSRTSANVNFLGDGIANLGAPGMLVIAFFAGVWFWILDSISEGKRQFSVMAIAIPSFALVNSALTTSLITHGLLVVALIIWLFPDKEGKP